MYINERDARGEQALSVAREMMAAARTAPKSKGVDIIEIATITGADIERLSAQMVIQAEQSGLKFLLRDAENLHQAQAVVLIGTKLLNHSLNCGYCGFATCALKPAATPCALNSIDVGIAVGSASAIAADRRVDSRVMFSAGWASIQLGLLPDCGEVIAIPISISSKSPFFDRKPKEDK